MKTRFWSRWRCPLTASFPTVISSISASPATTSGPRRRSRCGSGKTCFPPPSSTGTASSTKKSAKGFYTEDDIAVLHNYIKEQLKDTAFIDAIYYCPYHPRGQVEMYRIDSRDRKPNPGMIERAVADFAARGITVDLSRSIIVGDTEKDIETGINAGIRRRILVRSGHAIPDEAASKADAIFDSLADAARSIGSAC